MAYKTTAEMSITKEKTTIKPILQDFMNNPNNAMRNGYYPDFMSCLALKASILSIESLIDIKDEFIYLMREEVLLFPLRLICFLYLAVFLLTIPLFFPVWAFIYWQGARKAFKRYHEKRRT